MDMKDLRIGYVPYSMNLEGPGDRRRFCFYAKKRNIQFEVANPDKDYDLLYITSLADLSFWSNYKGNAKIVFEVIDSYLSVNKSDWKGQLRGLAKFVTRQSRYLQLDYRKAIQAMCQRADAVVCSTEEQKKDISEFCKNVHIILDVHSSVASHVKTDYSAGDVFNFVWEGLPFNVSSSFNEIREVLEYLQSKYKIALHLVTDLEYGKYMNKYGKQRTADIAKKIFPNTYIYEWNEQMCSTIITACDLALIPLPLDDTFLAGKPENKLLLLWRMGMPTVVSATPAYTRAMERSGLQMACRTQQDWQETLERYILDEAARREAGQNGKNFAESNYSEERILKLWDNLFESVLSVI